MHKITINLATSETYWIFAKAIGSEEGREEKTVKIDCEGGKVLQLRCEQECSCQRYQLKGMAPENQQQGVECPWDDQSHRTALTLFEEQSQII